MKATAWLTLAVVGLAASASAVRAQAGRPDSLAVRVDSIFAPYDKSHSPGCILGVSRNGALVYERGYGMANLEYGLAITPASIFHVASIAKQFTAASILLLAQRGQLSLDDDVRKYITELPDYGSRLTLRHLLTHTSGLRDAFQLGDLAEPRDVDGDARFPFVKRLALQRALNAVPGTEFAYLNAGYALLAVIVERVSGQSLHAFADSNIFKPLGMTHTHFHDNSTMIVPNRASGYYVDDAGGVHVAIDEWTVTYNSKNPGSRGVGNSNLFTTARDLLIWEQNFADVRVGDPALIAAMQAPTVLKGGDTSLYGFGLAVEPYRGLRAVGHGGGDPGYAAYVVRFPDHGLAIAVLCNVEDINTYALARRVADIYLAKVFPTPAVSRTTAALPRVSLSAEQLASKVGLYHDPLSDALRRIFVRDGKLMASRYAFGVGGTELRPLSANRFLLTSGTLEFEFVAAVDGGGQDIHEFLPGRKRPVVFQRVNAFAPSSAELSAFAGEYVSPELETTYTLAARDSGLVIQIRGRAEIVLGPIFADAFEGSRVGMVKFSRDANGVVTGFTVTSGGVRGLRFDRVTR